MARRPTSFWGRPVVLACTDPRHAAYRFVAHRGAVSDLLAGTARTHLALDVSIRRNLEWGLMVDLEVGEALELCCPGDRRLQLRVQQIEEAPHRRAARVLARVL